MLQRKELKDNYRRTMDRVAEAAIRSGRKPEDVHVVAVTKYAAPDQIRQIVEMGHQDLGESRVQQFQQRVAMIDEFIARHSVITSNKKTSVPAVVRWHMIGHMQRNKVRQALPLVTLIHSVDSLRLAEELETAAGKLGLQVDVLLQANVSGEKSKSGLSIPSLPHLADQVLSMQNLRLRGLMTMGPNTDDRRLIKTCFVRMAEVYEEMKTDRRFGHKFNILSMGMSNDFEIGIECGANIVRIGTAIFGPPDAAATAEAEAEKSSDAQIVSD